MFTTRRARRALMFEGLESRALLNGAVAGPSAAEIGALRAAVKATVIKGTIQGTVTSRSGDVVTYTGTGSVSVVGAVHLSGSHHLTSTQSRRGSTDTYTNGAASLSASMGTVQLTYTGSGTTRSNGHYTATLKGSAVVVAGSFAGRTGTFTATLSGTTGSSNFTISSTIKL